MLDYTHYTHQILALGSATTHVVQLRHLGRQDYASTQATMQSLAQQDRTAFTNQIWLLEHPSVYTQGTSCIQTTLLPSSIPVVKSDRGGQITYHGPGQLVLYPLLDLRSLGIGVKQLVNTLEQAVINVLDGFGIAAERKDNAPGVYINGAKIAALGLRVKNGLSYHGLSFNIAMDLEPFKNIDPCGFQGLKVTSLEQELERVGSQSELEVAPLGERVARAFVALL